jgi:hypothetical protein
MGRRGKRSAGSRQIIREALNSSPVDIETIWREAQYNGLPREFRAECWLRLLHIDPDNVCLLMSCVSPVNLDI